MVNKKTKVLTSRKLFSRSGSQTLFFGGREATTGNASALRRLRSPLQSEGSSGGRPKYHITAEQIDVLRTTGMSWTANAKCLRVSAKTLSRRRQEYGITDYTEIREDELEWNVRDILQLTPFSGETYLQGALRARGIHTFDALQQIDPVNRAVRHRYAIRRRIYNVNKTI